MGGDVTLTESLWVDMAWCQMTPMEHRILKPKTDTLAELETKLLGLNSRDLPAYRSSMCSRELERILTLIKGRNSAPKNKQKDKGPKSGRDDDRRSAGSGYCGYCRRKNPGHTFEECPKLAKRRERDSKNKTTGDNKQNPRKQTPDNHKAHPPPWLQAQKKPSKSERVQFRAKGDEGVSV